MVAEVSLHSNAWKLNYYLQLNLADYLAAYCVYNAQCKRWTAFSCTICEVVLLTVPAWTDKLGHWSIPSFHYFPIMHSNSLQTVHELCIS